MKCAVIHQLKAIDDNPSDDFIIPPRKEKELPMEYGDLLELLLDEMQNVRQAFIKLSMDINSVLSNKLHEDSIKFQKVEMKSNSKHSR